MSLTVAATAAVVCAEPSAADDRARIGIDANYALDMAARGQRWRDGEREVEPYALFAAHGCGHARIRLWVGDEGMNRLKYAVQTAQRARQAGLKPYLVLFLSEEWSDLVKQPAPAAWRSLTLERKAEAIEAYAESVVREMQRAGVELDTFEIGNEIDFGICGEFEEEWPKRVSREYMGTRVWPRMVPILRAAQAGVSKARPEAKFILHLAQWNDVDYCLDFWRAMLAAGVKIDLPGLSYFPSAAKDPAQRSFAELQLRAAKIADVLRRPVLICETGYPATAHFGGQFAEWNLPSEGYPLTPDGQAAWLRDLTALVRRDRNFAGIFYWSPEWYDGGLWDAFALFDAAGDERPGLRSLRP